MRLSVMTSTPGRQCTGKYHDVALAESQMDSFLPYDHRLFFCRLSIKHQGPACFPESLKGYFAGIRRLDEQRFFDRVSMLGDSCFSRMWHSLTRIRPFIRIYVGDFSFLSSSSIISGATIASNASDGTPDDNRAHLGAS